ncbi:MAG: heavy-metal-associated domain-containing protein [Proteobacteria bacterium]|nr:heavy-metal-associated domain-containing protein [Pseudomonadota bacterium]MBU1640394.1 heavy-metal-associated domain-containing protein [Pseudomonadota bacterium]
MATIKINGMKCQHCVSSVTKALASIKGVSDVSVNLETSVASYTADASVSSDKIKEAIRKIGFEPA